jgi:hypothetical protein
MLPLFIFNNRIFKYQICIYSERSSGQYNEKQFLEDGSKGTFRNSVCILNIPQTINIAYLWCKDFCYVLYNPHLFDIWEMLMNEHRSESLAAKFTQFLWLTAKLLALASTDILGSESLLTMFYCLTALRAFRQLHSQSLWTYHPPICTYSLSSLRDLNIFPHVEVFPFVSRFTSVKCLVPEFKSAVLTLQNIYNLRSASHWFACWELYSSSWYWSSLCAAWQSKLCHAVLIVFPTF